MMTLNRNVTSHHEENEQAAFGTGVLVDGIDFSDDKMLIGRTFSYSDTQRYRVGPNYLQLPINAPREDVAVNTNQTGGLMSYGRDNVGANPSINYEPSARAGLATAGAEYREYRPFVEGQIMRAPIDRTNNYGQAGDRIRTMPDWERDDLALNLTTLLADCDKIVQERMIAHFTKAEESFGKRLADGLGVDHSSLDIETLANVGTINT
jgi:catalase